MTWGNKEQENKHQFEKDLVQNKKNLVDLDSMFDPNNIQSEEN
jgi:hypothetical protein